MAASCNANVCRHELCAASRVNPGGASPSKERVAVPATSRRRDDPSFDVAGPGRASPPSGSQHPRGRRLPPRRRLQSLRRRLGGAARWRRSAAEGSCAALHAANRPTSVAHCRRRGRKRRRLSSWKPTSVWYNARTPLQLALCVRSPSGIVVNTVVRAGSMASSQGDVVLTRRRLQHAGPCWSTVSLDTTHTVEATTSYKPPQLTKLNTCGYHPCTRRV